MSETTCILDMSEKKKRDDVHWIHWFECPLCGTRNSSCFLHSFHPSHASRHDVKRSSEDFLDSRTTWPPIVYLDVPDYKPFQSEPCSTSSSWCFLTGVIQKSLESLFHWVQILASSLPLHINFRRNGSLACLKTDSTAIQGIQVSIAPMCAIEKVPEQVVRVWRSMIHWETSPLAEVSAYCESHSMIAQESLTICAWTRPFFFKSFRTVPWL